MPPLLQFSKACLPTATFWLPEVVSNNVSVPMATLPAPLVRFFNALLPSASFSEPVTAPAPIASKPTDVLDVPEVKPPPALYPKAVLLSPVVTASSAVSP